MSEKKSAIRLSRLTIKNYKKIDYLEIDFPRPLMKGDADILVFGSKNGGGKTSVLECCSLIMLAGVFSKLGSNFSPPMSIANFVKAGEKEAVIYGEIESNNKCSIQLKIDAVENSLSVERKGDKFLFGKFDKYFSDIPNIALQSVFSFSSEPLIQPNLIHFNSYRKVQESNPTLGMIASNETPNYVSLFKKEVIAALMGEKGLFEDTSQDNYSLILSKANELCLRYCGGEISQLQKLPDNTMVIRIKQKDGFSFPFDGLSSGQKEIIATLFLIWKNTQNQPSIVLIDEPELHLNAEWQSGFVRQLHKIAPNNQYILATHSETIFRSVDRNHRGLLDSNDNGVK